MSTTPNAYSCARMFSVMYVNNRTRVIQKQHNKTKDQQNKNPKSIGSYMQYVSMGGLIISIKVKSDVVCFTKSGFVC